MNVRDINPNVCWKHSRVKGEYVELAYNALKAAGACPVTIGTTQSERVYSVRLNGVDTEVYNCTGEYITSVFNAIADADIADDNVW
jgi:hypothetical protein